MPRGVPALVEPALLVWARQSAGLRLDEAAKKGQIKPETLHQWEQGEARPSIPQLRRLGEVYKRPLAVFFLLEPPKGFDPQREFRRLPALLLRMSLRSYDLLRGLHFSVEKMSE